ncbi:MAG: RDD family protein [Pirellulaceae bacterium]
MHCVPNLDSIFFSSVYRSAEDSSQDELDGAQDDSFGGFDVGQYPMFDERAGRFTRFAASIVDGILMAGFIYAIQVATGNWDRFTTQEVESSNQFAIYLIGIFVFLALNGYLLAKRGQTIGKLVTKIQIVDARYGNLLPFLRVYVLRYLWPFPFQVLAYLIPGKTDDLIFYWIVLIDVLVIFDSNRRCLHDYIAGSQVVLYRADRN